MPLEMYLWRFYLVRYTVLPERMVAENQLLSKIISGVYQRDGGTIEFNGQKIDKISPIDAINLGIQVIYQDFALFPKSDSCRKSGT